ncbi:hypothetical protein COY27_03150 [Candidatus Woesearchaeota archaeon CG_4_10_14_0_2_um_filter_33_13]|nr:MAG: hypothetical protein COY27_03150 [Candidatus Woesearchaeota archaeon CG_4_10_14_0_2_um_filter_33_13]
MEHIIETILEAREELKRLEHIIYVSLKYTRTVDVIVNALHRLIDVYDLIIEALLEKAKLENMVTSLPKSPALRARHLGELFPEDAELQKHLGFYSFLKSVLNLPHEKRKEYRRHVALVAELDCCTAELNIDNLTNCERFVHKFYHYAFEKISPKAKED